MSNVATVHAPGTFCWPELATTDQKAGVAYYRSLFGWDVNESPMGPDEVYSMFLIGGRAVGAASTLRQDARQQGVPPHWGSYVAVANADETTKRAKELGATVLAPPFDVMDAGRMAVIQDPTGAVFSVWQAGKHSGAGVLGENGSLCWTELATRDPAKAEKFYTQLFGWNAKTGNAAPGGYTEFAVPGKNPGAGMMQMPAEVPPFVPSYWMPYFAVADVDKAVATSNQLGGKVTVDAMDIPNVGRFAVLQDPQGAMFAVFTPRR